MSLDNAFKSLSLLRKYPVLYLPDLGYTVFNYLLIAILLFVFGIDLISILADLEAGATGVISTFLQENLMELIVSFVVFAVLTFFVGVGVVIMKYIIIKDMLQNKKITFKKAWQSQGKYFWDVVLLRIIVFFISLVAIAAIGLLTGLIYVLVSLVLPALAITFATVFGVLLMVAVLVGVRLSIMFRYPAMFLKKKQNAFKVLLQAFNFFKKHQFYSLITLLVILGITIFMAIFSWVVGLVVNLPGSLTNLITLVVIFGGLAWIAKLLIGITSELWTIIYLFKQYKDKKR